MNGVLLRLAYDGTGFSGWATQRDRRTVEDTLRTAILALDPQAVGPRGASRTDAGVHAESQSVAFDSSVPMQPRGWVLAINRRLPPDVSVRQARRTEVGFNPRFGSKRKRYRYDLLLDKVRDPLLCNRTWRIGYDMNMERMAREAKHIVGTHDFAAFRSATDARPVTERTIYSVDVTQSTSDTRVWSVAIEGSAFLHNMVRILVGTLMDVARGHLPEGTIPRALEGKDRALAGYTAPAHGLTLVRIDLALPAETGAPWPQ